MLFRVLSRHAFEGSFTAGGIADVALWNEKAVLIADSESPWEFRARLGCNLGDRVVELDIRWDPWEAVVDTWGRDGERRAVVVSWGRAAAAGPPAYPNSGQKYPRMLH